jgi:twinkle protein
MPQPEDFVPAIQFPYKKDGKVVNVKYRDLKKNWRQEVGAESIVYKFDDLKNLSELIICEGEIDALSFDEIGLTAVSVPNGAPAPNAKNYESEFGYLEALKDMIGSCDKVLLAVDDDEAGQKLESELCRRIGKEKCWRLFYPPGCKDANEILSKHGQEGLQKAYDGSEPYPLDGIISIKGMRKDTENLYDHGYDRGHSTGWASLNDYYRVREGEFTVVTGVPSHGKSTWLDHLMVNMAVRDDWKFAVFTPENLPLHKHLAGLLEKYIQKPFDKGYQERMDREELDRALAWAQEHFMYIFPTKDTVHVDDVLELAKACVYRDGVKGIVLDPWNEMEHSRSGSVTETEFVSEVLSKVRRFSRLREVHFWIVAHPTKLRKVMEDGKLRYPIPTPYDISGSAHWRNKADNCITVWRDLNSKDSLVEIHIQKIRFKEMGKPGKVVLKWSRPTGCFVDLEK